MIIAITVVVIIIVLRLLKIIINISVNNNSNVSKSQVIWLKKCLRLCLKVFQLWVFFTVSRIWFWNEGPIKDKAFWLVFVFQKVI